MKLWRALYGLIWLVFLEIWLAFTPLAPPIPLYLHGALGVGIVGLSYWNFQQLRATRVPGRIKRIAQATLSLSLIMSVLGGLLWFHLGASWSLLFGIAVEGAIRFLHFVNAMAIITQASAVAIAYDMWEDREFLADTAPGEIPPAPRPGAPGASG